MSTNMGKEWQSASFGAFELNWKIDRSGKRGRLGAEGNLFLSYQPYDSFWLTEAPGEHEHLFNLHNAGYVARGVIRFRITASGRPCLTMDLAYGPPDRTTSLKDYPLDCPEEPPPPPEPEEPDLPEEEFVGAAGPYHDLFPFLYVRPWPKLSAGERERRFVWYDGAQASRDSLYCKLVQLKNPLASCGSSSSNTSSSDTSSGSSTPSGSSAQSSESSSSNSSAQPESSSSSGSEGQSSSSGISSSSSLSSSSSSSSAPSSSESSSSSASSVSSALSDSSSSSESSTLSSSNTAGRMSFYASSSSSGPPVVRFAMEQAAVAFIEGGAGFAGQFVKSVKELKGPIRDFGRIDEYLRGDPALIHQEGLLAIIEDVLRGEIQVYIEQPKYVSQKDDLWQSLFALTIILGYRTHLLDEIIMTLVVCELIERIARGDKALETTEGIMEAARATIILPPEIFPLPPAGVVQDVGRRKVEWIEPYAIGDLQIVRQRLLTYTLGEVASIESILRSERKETTHRKLRQVMESTSGENIRLEESEVDLHGTRAELLNETQKTVAHDSITTTFCKFSTTYGPPAVATLDGSWNVQNNPQSPRVSEARKFAQNITTRTANRMARRVSETRTVNTLDEAESTIVRAFDNTSGDGNVVGIYRWVNKIYRAHVVNYGHRLLIELMISDPAGAYIQGESQLQGLNLNEPVPPNKLPPPVGGIHSYKDITRANYAPLTALYEVREIIPPPPEFQSRATSFQGGAAVNVKEIAIPEGYRAVEASVTYVLTGDSAVGLAGIVGSRPFIVPALTIPSSSSSSSSSSGSSSSSSASGTPAGMCAPSSVSSGNATAGTQCLLMNGEDTILPVAVMLTTSGGDGPSSSSSSSSSSGSSVCGGLALNPYVPGESVFPNDAWALGSYFVTIQVQCALTAEKFAEWQLKTYNAIIQGYQKQKGEYYASAGSGPTGRAARNPLASREIEKSELKKDCMRLLMERYFDLVGVSLREDGGPPQIAVDAPRYCQFFEQAFEWNEMTYSFYSRVKIPGLVGEAPEVTVWPGDDPLFTSFLEAGAASVMLPVKPDYDLIVLYYLSSGMIWDGANALTPTVDEYVSIVNELKTVSMTVDRAVEDGEGWDILVPTSMTMLQAKPTLPHFKPVPRDH